MQGLTNGNNVKMCNLPHPALDARLRPIHPSGAQFQGIGKLEGIVTSFLW